MTETREVPTTLQAVLNASNTLITNHCKLVQFLYQNFGEDGIQELEIYTSKVGSLLQEQELAFSSTDGKVSIE